MAHFAKLDNNDIVTQVLVVNNDVILKADGTESELKGKQFLNATFGQSKWVQTSYNHNFRKQYAGLGYKYDSTNDVFIAPQPFNSWTLDSDFNWQPPISKPTDEKPYKWNEDTQSWDLYKPTQPFTSWTWDENNWEWTPPTAMPINNNKYYWDEDTLSWVLDS
jgi:hypothetical protein